MNVVCLVDGAPDEIALANRLHGAFGLRLLVRCEQPPVQRLLLRRVREHGVAAALDAGRARLTLRASKRREHAAYDRWLGDSWRALHPDVPVLTAPSLNDAEVVARLSALDDVALVVHASSIVRQPVLERCAHAFNLHWGLSPYYRGTRCTEWALMHWDVLNLGVTVHELTPQVDAGAIVGQARAVVRDDDTVQSINTQLTALGIEIVLDTLRLVGAGGVARRVEQDTMLGLVSLKRQWSAALSRHVRRLERGGLAAMLAAPARGTLPIVELTAR